MVSGGYRVGAGRKPDPSSGRSERNGFELAALPNSGYKGAVPEFPLSRFVIRKMSAAGSLVMDKRATNAWEKREKELWEALWRTPQACAWSMAQNAYMLFDIALYTRQLVICESSDAKAADRSLLPRYADRIGMSPAGLITLGWKITPDELANKRMESEEFEASAPQPRRLRG